MGLVIYSEFTDRAAQDAYQAHPKHLAIKPIVAALRESRAAVDYEASRLLNFSSFAADRFYAILSGSMLVYAVTIFLSAFLLFQVQPLIAKFILPWFGGSAAVWSAALLFFQLVLLAGYFYAYVVIRYLKPKQQFWVHASLLAVSLATLPIIPSPVFKATGGRGSYGAHPIVIGGYGGVALYVVVGYESAAAGLVCAGAAGGGALPVVCACRILDRCWRC